MKDVRVRAHVRVAESDVARTLTDMRQWSAWRPAIAKVSNISDEPLVMAAAWTETRLLHGREIVLRCRVVELDLPRTFAYIAEGDAVRYSIRWILTNDDRTLVTQSASATATTWRGRIAGLDRLLLDQEADNLHRLRTLIQPSIGEP